MKNVESRDRDMVVREEPNGQKTIIAEFVDCRLIREYDHPQYAKNFDYKYSLMVLPAGQSIRDWND